MTALSYADTTKEYWYTSDDVQLRTWYVILGIITTVILRTSGTSFSNWTSTYGFLIFVPVIVFITRKMYKVTKSIWLGSSINSLLIGWIMVCTIGYNSYVAQNWISNFFNI